MQKVVSIVVVAATVALFALPAAADKIINNYYGDRCGYEEGRRHHHHHHQHDHSYGAGGHGRHYPQGYVPPAYSYGPPAAAYYPPSAYRSYTPIIGGAIVGGLIGNQFGRGSGRKALTAAGVILGGSIGRDYEYRNRYR
jgi:hypothetical protein